MVDHGKLTDQETSALCAGFGGEISFGVMAQQAAKVEAGIKSNVLDNPIERMLAQHMRVRVVRSLGRPACAKRGSHAFLALVDSGLQHQLQVFCLSILQREDIKQLPAIAKMHPTGPLADTIASLGGNDSAKASLYRGLHLGTIAALFIVLHEVGHILCGHLAMIGRANVLSETGQERRLIRHAALHACEFQADRFAILLAASQVSGAAYQCATPIDSPEDLYDIMLIIVWATGLFFISSGGPEQSKTHPSPSERMIHAGAWLSLQFSSSRKKDPIRIMKESAVFQLLSGEAGDSAHADEMLAFDAKRLEERIDRLRVRNFEKIAEEYAYLL